MGGRSKVYSLWRTETPELNSYGQMAALVQDTRIGTAPTALRQINIDQLKDHMEAFYEHGTLPDLVMLCAAFDRIERERLDWSPERAWLVDTLLMMCNRLNSLLVTEAYWARSFRAIVCYICN